MNHRISPSAAFTACNVALAAFVGAIYVLNLAHPFYHGPANLSEFLLYSLAIASLSTIGWLAFPRADLPAPALALMQLGILGHLAGGFLEVRGGRLYELVILGLGYDHYLHAFNGFAGAMLADRLLPQIRGPAIRALVVTLVMMGAGAMVEIVEYLAVLMISATGVGDYQNNMRDLVSNLIGGLIFLAGRALADSSAASAVGWKGRL